MMTFCIDDLKIIWRYLSDCSPLIPANAILVLGSNDIRVAEYAADLWHKGWAPQLIFSGGFGRLTRGVFAKPEAEIFADVARSKGVPGSHIAIEPHSTHTGENIRFTQALLQQQGRGFKSLMLVQKPFMMRRALATARQQWPEQVFSSAPSGWTLDEYAGLDLSAAPSDCHNDAFPATLLAAMLGEIERLQSYPKQGFIAAQVIPDDVLRAYDSLRAGAVRRD